MIQRRKSVGRAVAAKLLLALLAGTLGAAPTTLGNDAPALVEQLGDRAPDVRNAAVARLTRIGRPARAALLAAASDDEGPAQRRRLARAILRQLPLTDADDPASLRAAMRPYEAAAPDARPAIALRWLGSKDEAAMDALARVFTDEPDADVLWTIVASIRPDDRTRVTSIPAVASFEPTSPPQLYLAGITTEDPKRAAALLDRCLRETRTVPPAAYTAITRVGNALAGLARDAKDAARELDVRRAVALLIPPDASGRLSTAAEAYLESRLRLRDAGGLDDDLQTLGIAPTLPSVRLIASVLKLPAPPPKAAPLAVRDVPGPVWETIDSLTLDEQMNALEVLYRGGELGIVDAVTTRLLSQLANNRDPNVEMRRVQVYMLRYNVANAGRDRDAAAEALRAALAKMPRDATVTRRDGDGSVTQMPVSSLFAEMHIAQLRRAIAGDDRAAIDATLDQLALISIDNSTHAIDAIYLFEQFGRLREADEVYAEYVAEAYARLDASPDSASAMNGVAWFSARTGRNLQVAYRLASEAIRRSPDSAALLDTFAEAAYRTGRHREAADAERRALAQRPDDPFMVAQLARFSTPPQPGDAERALPSESWTVGGGPGD